MGAEAEVVERALMPAFTPMQASAALLPRTLDEAMRLAELLATSDLVPREFRDKPGNVLVAIQMGMEVGLGPMQAVQSIAVINGRPAMWGDAVLGVVMASGQLADLDEQYVREGDQAEQVYAVCRVQRKGNDRIVERRFSWADAVRANLSGKDTYKAYPKRMLQCRARAWALRDVFPDVLRGLQIREEVEDFVVDAEPVPTSTPDDMMPKAKPNGDPAASVAGGVTTPAPPVLSDEDAMLGAMVGEEPVAQPHGDPGVEGARQPLAGPEPVDEELTREALLDKIDRLVGDRLVKAPFFAQMWTAHVGCDRNVAPLAKLKKLYRVLDGAIPTQAAKQEKLPSGQKSGQVTFIIGKTTYTTAGITKEQLLRAFDLGDQVNKKAQSGDVAKAMLAKEFKVSSRTELTAEQADQYLMRLRETLEG